MYSYWPHLSRHDALPFSGAGLVGRADAPRDTAAQAVAELQALGVDVVMLTGDNEATARRIGTLLGVTDVIAEVLPGDKASKVAELQAGGRRVADRKSTRLNSSH